MKIKRNEPVDDHPSKRKSKGGRKPGSGKGGIQHRSKTRLYFKVKPFVDQYLIDHNAVKAWQRAGFGSGNYSNDCIQAQKAMARPDVQQMIHERQLELSQRVEITQEMVIKELMAIAFSNIKDILRWEENGSINFFSSDSISREKAAAISEINQVINANGSGSMKFKFYDKQSALIMIGKYLGMFFDESKSIKDPVEEAKKIKQALKEIENKIQK
jgi:phage terminase small subunit